jgi:hypothetical protein
MRRILVCVLLLCAGPVWGAARHEVPGVTKIKGGARFRIRLVPEGGYNKVTIGVASGSVGRYGRIQKSFATNKSVPQRLELTFDLKYDGRRFKKGEQVTVISRWPAFGRTHHWGQGTHRLP